MTGILAIVAYLAIGFVFAMVMVRYFDAPPDGFILLLWPMLVATGLVFGAIWAIEAPLKAMKARADREREVKAEMDRLIDEVLKR